MKQQFAVNQDKLVLQGLSKPWQIEIIGKKANDLSYQIRDGSQERNVQLRSQEAQWLRQNYPKHKIVVLNQVHGNDIIHAHDQEGKGSQPYQELTQAHPVWAQADGSYCHDPDFLLTVVTADCLAIFFHIPNSSIMAAVHAGWQGTKKKISEKMIKILIQEYRVDSSQIHCHILPGISGPVYEVKQDVAQHFPDCITREQGKIFLDLPLANQKQILAQGIPQENISMPAYCTYNNNDMLFSHRKGDKGRNLNIIYRQK